MNMVGDTLDVMEEPHVEDKHEEDVYLQVLVKRHDENKLAKHLLGLRRRMDSY